MFFSPTLITTDNINSRTTPLTRTLDEKMDLQQLQNQYKYEVNTTFDQICFYFP